ncbi:hypothetical protein [Candidatus Neptunochlamydia vexilliferae]|uniref:Lipoprotein n=1 Tax=Candidatus Neptunichlamydia vexilliferae TaxID=1651774 RepID=A0ABS0AYU5_9BACT|nr:hypothetical protein [Candidatus Neptunochlamydia vexilliferae]MBF5059145.1 hypothetical protein [Candidatus Neptunochlamydia vexilliferae]
MKKKTILLFCLAGALIVGCTSYRGTRELAELTVYDVEQAIIDGKTHKHEVIARFGTQYELEEDFEGREKWVYSLSTYKPKLTNLIPIYGEINKGTDNKDYKLTIFFDEKGIVIRHRFHQKEYESTRWHSYHPAPVAPSSTLELDW